MILPPRPSDGEGTAGGAAGNCGGVVPLVPGFARPAELPGVLLWQPVDAVLDMQEFSSHILLQNKIIFSPLMLSICSVRISSGLIQCN